MGLGADKPANIGLVCTDTAGGSRPRAAIRCITGA